jgi:hypothetical protein
MINKKDIKSIYKSISILNNIKCIHRRSFLFCCKCNYGSIKEKEEVRQPLTKYFSLPIGIRLIDAYELIQAN